MASSFMALTACFECDRQKVEPITFHFVLGPLSLSDGHVKQSNAVSVLEVSELQRENQASVGKLQQTAEQCEWLCQQQRYWMFRVKR